MHVDFRYIPLDATGKLLQDQSVPISGMVVVRADRFLLEDDRLLKLVGFRFMLVNRLEDSFLLLLLSEEEAPSLPLQQEGVFEGLFRSAGRRVG